MNWAHFFIWCPLILLDLFFTTIIQEKKLKWENWHCQSVEIFEKLQREEAV